MCVSFPDWFILFLETPYKRNIFFQFLQKSYIHENKTQKHWVQDCLQMCQKKTIQNFNNSRINYRLFLYSIYVLREPINYNLLALRVRKTLTLPRVLSLETQLLFSKKINWYLIFQMTFDFWMMFWLGLFDTSNGFRNKKKT